MQGRVYADAGRKAEWFKVYFTDERGRAFHRLVYAEHKFDAIARAAVDDRIAGGGSVVVLGVETA